MPRFSIVIPTRNRANLLPMAVQSALEQDIGDVEVVLSDNDSSDGTPEVGRRLACDRLRYVRTAATMPMPDHWEFALSHARGDYVTVLCDDDAVGPNLCSRVDAELRQNGREVVSWRRYSYIHPDWHEVAERNTLTLKIPSGRSELHDAAPYLHRWMDSAEYCRDAPMMFSAFCKRELIQKIIGKAGRFFISPAPDVGSSVAMLAFIKSFSFIDDVLALGGVARQSIGASQRHGPNEATRNFAAEFKGKIFERVKFKANLVSTTVADTLLNAHALLPEELAHYPVNLANFYLQAYVDLSAHRQNGVDVSKEMAELMAIIDADAPEVRGMIRKHDFRKGLKSINHFWRWIFRTKLGIGSKRKSRRVTIYGKDAGFTNILECARQLPKIVAQLRSR